MSSFKNLRIGLACFVLFSLCTPLTKGQSVDRALPSVDLSPPDVYWNQVETLVQVAIAENPFLRGMRNEEGISQQRLRQNRLIENPMVSAQLDRRPGGVDRERMIDIDIPLPIDGRREARVRTSRAELEEARNRIQDEERMIAMRVRESVANTIAARTKLRLLRETLELAERNRANTAQAVDAGLSAPLDLSRETVFVNSLRVRLESAEAEVVSMESELAALLGRSNLADIVLPSFLPNVRYDGSVTNALALERSSNRPDLLASASRISVAQGRLGEARSEGRPKFNLMLGLRDMRLGFPFQGIDSNGGFSMIEDRMRYRTFGIRIELPLFNRNQGEVAAGKLELSAAQSFARGTGLSVESEVNSSVSRYTRASRALDITIKGVITPARDNFRVLSLAYREGAISLDEFLREQRELLNLEIELIEAARFNAVAEALMLGAVGVGSFDSIGIGTTNRSNQ